MNDEIKEILDKAKEISKYGDDGKQHTRFFNQFEAKSLLDYITNLQTENKILKELNVCVGCNNNTDYKLRIDKALEYIENTIITIYDDKYTKINSNHYVDDLLNILRGESNE